MSKGELLLHIRQALAQQGVDSTGITGHSFRIGAATAAARAGLEDSLIQTLGRWHSGAYLRYIWTLERVLAAASSRLLHPALHPQSSPPASHLISGWGRADVSHLT